ncbi:hypothetical protein CDL12_01930 [Handroanthus impetiginosus]|uniref:Uncharacterized protein n=1 Tax=Handroanthus impetiginosus TaxID=429701 RepID=A0A2G9I6D7_9LAMI|nr:hypothetical protein CDL12_01930 [Handroanthus impetiginosus]
MLLQNYRASQYVHKIGNIDPMMCSEMLRGGTRNHSLFGSIWRKRSREQQLEVGTSSCNHQTITLGYASSIMQSVSVVITRFQHHMVTNVREVDILCGLASL